MFLCSTENLQRRGDAEVAFLMEVIEQVVADRLAKQDARWQVHIAGMLDALPDTTARALKEAVEADPHLPDRIACHAGRWLRRAARGHRRPA